jgi:Uma2 family endonuclease
MSGNVTLKENASEEYWTYADYREWELAPGERYEVYRGKAVAMAGPNTYHQLILVELTKQIAVYLTGKPCKVIPAPFDVRLFYEKDGSDDTVLQPDIVVVCDEKKLGPEGCRGAPDFVVEILSPSNRAIEMELKFELYRQAGVKEYWVIDPEHKSVHCYRFNGGEIVVRSYGAAGTAPVEALNGLEIALEPVFAG